MIKEYTSVKIAEGESESGYNQELGFQSLGYNPKMIDDSYR